MKCKVLQGFMLEGKKITPNPKKKDGTREDKVVDIDDKFVRRLLAAGRIEPMGELPDGKKKAG